jgi:hypothetical protein
MDRLPRADLLRQSVLSRRVVPMVQLARLVLAAL